MGKNVDKQQPKNVPQRKSAPIVETREERKTLSQEFIGKFKNKFSKTNDKLLKCAYEKLADVKQYRGGLDPNYLDVLPTIRMAVAALYLHTCAAQGKLIREIDPESGSNLSCADYVKENNLTKWNDIDYDSVLINISEQTWLEKMTFGDLAKLASAEDLSAVFTTMQTRHLPAPEKNAQQVNEIKPVVQPVVQPAPKQQNAPQVKEEPKQPAPKQEKEEPKQESKQVQVPQQVQQPQPVQVVAPSEQGNRYQTFVDGIYGTGTSPLDPVYQRNHQHGSFYGGFVVTEGIKKQLKNQPVSEFLHFEDGENGEYHVMHKIPEKGRHEPKEGEDGPAVDYKLREYMNRVTQYAYRFNFKEDGTLKDDNAVKEIGKVKNSDIIKGCGISSNEEAEFTAFLKDHRDTVTNLCTNMNLQLHKVVYYEAMVDYLPKLKDDSKVGVVKKFLEDSYDDYRMTRNKISDVIHMNLEGNNTFLNFCPCDVTGKILEGMTNSVNNYRRSRGSDELKFTPVEVRFTEQARRSGTTITFPYHVMSAVEVKLNGQPYTMTMESTAPPFGKMFYQPDKNPQALGLYQNVEQIKETYTAKENYVTRFYSKEIKVDLDKLTLKERGAIVDDINKEYKTINRLGGMEYEKVRINNYRFSEEPPRIDFNIDRNIAPQPQQVQQPQPVNKAVERPLRQDEFFTLQNLALDSYNSWLKGDLQQKRGKGAKEFGELQASVEECLSYLKKCGAQERIAPAEMRKKLQTISKKAMAYELQKIGDEKGIKAFNKGEKVIDLTNYRKSKRFTKYDETERGRIIAAATLGSCASKLLDRYYAKESKKMQEDEKAVRDILARESVAIGLLRLPKEAAKKPAEKSVEFENLQRAVEGFCILPSKETGKNIGRLARAYLRTKRDPRSKKPLGNWDKGTQGRIGFADSLVDFSTKDPLTKNEPKVYSSDLFVAVVTGRSLKFKGNANKITGSSARDVARKQAYTMLADKGSYVLDPNIKNLSKRDDRLGLATALLLLTACADQGKSISYILPNSNETSTCRQYLEKYVGDQKSIDDPVLNEIAKQPFVADMRLEDFSDLAGEKNLFDYFSNRMEMYSSYVPKEVKKEDLPMTWPQQVSNAMTYVVANKLKEAPHLVSLTSLLTDAEESDSEAELNEAEQAGVVEIYLRSKAAIDRKEFSKIIKDYKEWIKDTARYKQSFDSMPLERVFSTFEGKNGREVLKRLGKKMDWLKDMKKKDLLALAYTPLSVPEFLENRKNVIRVKEYLPGLSKWSYSWKELTNTAKAYFEYRDHDPKLKNIFESLKTALSQQENEKLDDNMKEKVVDAFLYSNQQNRLDLLVSVETINKIKEQGHYTEGMTGREYFENHKSDMTDPVYQEIMQEPWLKEMTSKGIAMMTMAAQTVDLASCFEYMRTLQQPLNIELQKAEELKPKPEIKDENGNKKRSDKQPEKEEEKDVSGESNNNKPQKDNEKNLLRDVTEKFRTKAEQTDDKLLKMAYGMLADEKVDRRIPLALLLLHTFAANDLTTNDFYLDDIGVSYKDYLASYDLTKAGAAENDLVIQALILKTQPFLSKMTLEDLSDLSDLPEMADGENIITFFEDMAGKYDPKGFNKDSSVMSNKGHDDSQISGDEEEINEEVNEENKNEIKEENKEEIINIINVNNEPQASANENIIKEENVEPQPEPQAEQNAPQNNPQRQKENWKKQTDRAYQYAFMKSREGETSRDSYLGTFLRLIRSVGRNLPDSGLDEESQDLAKELYQLSKEAEGGSNKPGRKQAEEKLDWLGNIKGIEIVALAYTTESVFKFFEDKKKEIEEKKPIEEVNEIKPVEQQPQVPNVQQPQPVVPQQPAGEDEIKEENIINISSESQSEPQQNLEEQREQLQNFKYLISYNKRLAERYGTIVPWLWEKANKSVEAMERMLDPNSATRQQDFKEAKEFYPYLYIAINSEKRTYLLEAHNNSFVEYLREFSSPEKERQEKLEKKFERHVISEKKVVKGKITEEDNLNCIKKYITDVKNACNYEEADTFVAELLNSYKNDLIFNRDIIKQEKGEPVNEQPQNVPQLAPKQPVPQAQQQDVPQQGLNINNINNINDEQQVEQPAERKPAPELMTYDFTDDYNFNKGQMITYNMLMTGNVEEMTEYLNKQSIGKLTEQEEKHLKQLIAANQHIQYLQDNRLSNKRTELPQLEEREDGKILLKGNWMERNQSCSQGCWSVAGEMLLKSRGVYIPQEMLRAFRSYKGKSGDMPQDYLDKKTVRTFNTDSSDEVVRCADVITSTLPNTGMRVRYYKFEQNDFDTDATLKEKKSAIKEKLLADIQNTIKVKRSPVSLFNNGHYYTVLGVDPRNEQLYVRDSLAFTNDIFACDVSRLVDLSAQKEIGGGAIQVSWVEDLKFGSKDGLGRLYDENGKLPQNPENCLVMDSTATVQQAKVVMQLGGVDNLSYVTDHYYLPNELTPEKDLKDYHKIAPPDILHGDGLMYNLGNKGQTAMNEFNSHNLVYANGTQGTLAPFGEIPEQVEQQNVVPQPIVQPKNEVKIAADNVSNNEKAQPKQEISAMLEKNEPQQQAGADSNVNNGRGQPEQQDKPENEDFSIVDPREDMDDSLNEQNQPDVIDVLEKNVAIFMNRERTDADDSWLNRMMFSATTDFIDFTRAIRGVGNSEESRRLNGPRLRVEAVTYYLYANQNKTLEEVIPNFKEFAPPLDPKTTVKDYCRQFNDRSRDKSEENRLVDWIANSWVGNLETKDIVKMVRAANEIPTSEEDAINKLSSTFEAAKDKCMLIDVQREMLKTYLASMEDSQSEIRGEGSTEFRILQGYTKNCLDALDPDGEGEYPSVESMEAITQKLGTLAGWYLNTKPGEDKNYSEKTQRRINIADDLKDNAEYLAAAFAKLGRGQKLQSNNERASDLDNMRKKNAMQSFADRITISQRKIWGSGSQQFRNIRTELQNYKKAISIGADETAAAQRLGEAVDAYLALKSDANKPRRGWNDNTKERIKIAKDLQNYMLRLYPPQLIEQNVIEQNVIEQNVIESQNNAEIEPQINENQQLQNKPNSEIVPEESNKESVIIKDNAPESNIIYLGDEDDEADDKVDNEKDVGVSRTKTFIDFEPEVDPDDYNNKISSNDGSQAELPEDKEPPKEPKTIVEKQIDQLEKLLNRMKTSGESSVKFVDLQGKLNECLSLMQQKARDPNYAGAGDSETKEKLGKLGKYARVYLRTPASNRSDVGTNIANAVCNLAAQYEPKRSFTETVIPQNEGDAKKRLEGFCVQLKTIEDTSKDQPPMKYENLSYFTKYLNTLEDRNNKTYKKSEKEREEDRKNTIDGIKKYAEEFIDEEKIAFEKRNQPISDESQLRITMAEKLRDFAVGYKNVLNKNVNANKTNAKETKLQKDIKSLIN